DQLRVELAEALIVVVRVEPVVRIGLVETAGHDAPGAAVVLAGGLDGELAVVVAVLVRQQPLSVLEAHAVVAWIVVGPAGLDVLDHREDGRRHLQDITLRYAGPPQGGSLATVAGWLIGAVGWLAGVVGRLS